VIHQQFNKLINQTASPLMWIFLGLILCGIEASDVARAEDEKPAETTAEKTPDEEAEEKPLIKLEDMVPPTAEQLLQGKPLTWVVLVNDDVVVVEPVNLKPNTLERMAALIKETYNRKPKSQQELATLRVERDRLNYLELILIDGGADPERRIHRQNVKNVIHYEDMLLNQAKEYQTQGKLSDSFEFLLVLERRVADWPGANELQEQLLFQESKQLLQEKDYETALVRLEDLDKKNQKFLGLTAQIAKVADALIDQSFKQQDFRRARHFLNRFWLLRPKHDVYQKWSERLNQQVGNLLNQASTAAAEGKFDLSAQLTGQASAVWPRNSSLKAAHRRAISRYQTLSVGVLRLAGDPTPFFLPSNAEKRERYLTQANLFEVESADSFAHYRSGFFEQWEPTELGRMTVFHLRQSRAAWESQPVLTSQAVTKTFLAMLNPASQKYDERFSSYVSSVSVESPFQFTVHFDRAPLRSEAFFSVPVQTASLNSSKDDSTLPELNNVLSERFRITKKTANEVIYHRSVPEPVGLPQYHVAQVVEKRYPSLEKSLQGLVRGEISALLDVPHQYLDQLKENGEFVIKQSALPVTHILQFNPKNKYLRNLELRRAMALGIDRRRILKDVFSVTPQSPTGRLVSAPYSSLSFGYNQLIKPREHNLTLAFSLLISAKNVFKKTGGLPTFRMVCEPDSTSQAAAVEVIQDWTRIGLNVELITDANQEPKVSRQDNWDIIYRKVQMVEPIIELWPLLTLEETAKLESLKYLPNWLRQELLELENVSNFSAATSRLFQLHKHLKGSVQLIPLWEVDNYTLLRKNIRGYPNRLMTPYQGIERWIIQPWFPNESP